MTFHLHPYLLPNKFHCCCLLYSGTPLVRPSLFAPEKWHLKRGGLSSGVEINTFMLRFTLSSGLSRGGGLSSGWPLNLLIIWKKNAVHSSSIVYMQVISVTMFAITHYCNLKICSSVVKQISPTYACINLNKVDLPQVYAP